MDLKHLEIVAEIARIAHTIGNAMDEAEGLPTVAWKDLDIPQRISAQGGVIHVMNNPEITPETLVKITRDPADAEHTRLKDHLFIATVRALYP